MGGCDDSVGWVDVTLGIALVVGTVVSYVDQFFQLGLQWSHIGVSFSSLFFLNWSAGMNTIDSLFLQWSDVECCVDGHVFQCLGSLLPTIQLISNFVCQMGVYFLAVAVFRSDGTRALRMLFGSALAGLIFLCSLFLLLFGLGLVFLHTEGRTSNAFEGYDVALGIASAIPPFFCYVPQIWTTFRLNDRGSLSLLQFLIQTPGSFFVAGYQALNQLWIVSIPSFVVGVQQLILLIMLIYYAIRNFIRRRRMGPKPLESQEEDAHLSADEATPDPATPLLLNTNPEVH